MPGWMLTLTTLHLSTPGANKGVKTQSSTPLSNRSTIFHCAVTLTSSCITLRPPATQLMRLPECSQIRIASSPFPHGTRFSRFSVCIPLTLMSLDSNVQFHEKGIPLRHFMPFYTPMSSGINIFAQVISWDENAYVFPPFVMMGPLLKFLLQARITVTIIAPQLSPIPYWWPILKGASSDSLLLGSKGEGGVLLFPSPHVCFATRPLQWDLFAFRFEPSPRFRFLYIVPSNLASCGTLPGVPLPKR